MDAPSRERWQRIEQLADAALDCPAEERAAYLRNACGDDAELYAWVAKLIEAGESEDSVLDTAAADYAPGLVKRSLSRAEAEPVPHARIGPYRIIRELGRGGMGVVYLAEREEHFQQQVALKVVRRGLHLDAHLVQRFVDERQILASLEHPNIARLLDGGLTEDGVPWFAMELVSGEPLNQACDARRLSIEARLELFCTVCDAVEYAHRRQIVHRDLKPSNILVNADGIVKLVDFGIAKLVAPDHDTERSLTRTGVRLLTPEYASPEQLRGQPVSPASDVYSLGVLLYELLTGRRPYRVAGRTTEDLEQAVLHQEPTRPSTVVTRTGDGTGTDASTTNATQQARARGTTPQRLSERLRGDLDNIVLNALVKDPKRRYGSAAALAADVRRYLDGMPVKRRLPIRVSRRSVVIASSIVLLGAAVGLWSRRADDGGIASSAETPVLAVGLISDFRADGAPELAGSIADLLATNLARVASLRVISSGRLFELIQPATVPANAGAYTAAARRAGAAMIVEGSVHRLPDGALRLDLRRIDVATGNVLAAETVSSHDIFALVDSGTARLAAGVGASAPAGSIADVTTRSVVAYRFYEEGLRTYYRGDVMGARHLFDAALTEDTTFAMAAYYLALTEQPGYVSYNVLQRAVQLADRASDRERLVIRAAWGERTSDPSLLATAETLTVRYPQELYGQLLLGRALIYADDFAGAIPRLRHVVKMDSMVVPSANGQCTACDARSDIIGAYIVLDSLATAEREARAWIALQPRAAQPWMRLAQVQLNRGDFDAADDSHREAASFNPAISGGPAYYAYHRLLAGDYDGTERALRAMTRSGAPERRREAIWYLTIALRWQGRFAEALQTIRSYNGPETTPLRLDRAQLEAQVLLEAGHARASAAYFDSLAHGQLGEIPPYRARFQTWALAHGANALFAAGDTTRLAARIDTIQVLGAKSLLARDQRMHHYIRGLLHVARGNDEAAIAEFRQARPEHIAGYVRISYELARALLRLDRPREAVAVLQPYVRVPVEATYLYVTRTEMRELLARAWDKAGRPDSANVHYDAVLAAWANADPILQSRVQDVRARRAALAQSRQ